MVGNYLKCLNYFNKKRLIQNLGSHNNFIILLKNLGGIINSWFIVHEPT